MHTEHYDKFYKHYDFPQFLFADKFVVKGIIKKLSMKMKSRILDLGCGTGRFASLFDRYGMDSYGIDLSLSAIKRARIRYPKTKYLQMDANDLQFEKKSFDLIFSHGFSLFNVKNLDERKEFMDYIFSFLKEKSTFLFIMTSRLNGNYNKNMFYNHKISDLKMFFDENYCKEFKIEYYTLFPQLFYLFRKLIFSSSLSRICNLTTNVSKIPLRLYIFLKGI